MALRRELERIATVFVVAP
ncbi:MAG: hypothetical protein NUV35_04770, partial [Syntrophomonadaceae bacterium]|nr:hypothetical protein [Syntrophomonadaceae bacterium]